MGLASAERYRLPLVIEADRVAHPRPGGRFHHGLTRPFDLVAPGGAHDVWIAEVGDADRWGGFDVFVGALTAAPVDEQDGGVAAGGRSRSAR